MGRLYVDTGDHFVKIRTHRENEPHRSPAMAPAVEVQARELTGDFG